MKRFALLLTICLLVSGVIPASGQDLFVSSDGAIIMTVPLEWSVMETGPGSLFAIADDGAQVAITYDAALRDQMTEEDRALLAAAGDDLTPLETASLTTFALAEAAGIEPVVTSQTLRDRDVLRYVDLREDGSYDAYYVTSTEFTGLIQFAVYGAREPVLPLLTLLDAIDPPPPVAFDCASVTIARDSAAPGAIIDVANVPVGLDDFYAQASAPDVAEALPVPIIATDEEAVMLSPLHPDLRLEGGAVTLELLHNGALCHEIAFEVLPVPEAPGELDRFINAAQDLIDASVAFLGVTQDDLLATPVPEALIPLAEAQFLISHPDNPGALDTLAEVAEPDELRLLEALLAHDGYVAMLESRAAIVRERIPTAQGEGWVQFVSDHEPLPQRVTPFNAWLGVTINTAQDLSYYMRYQAAFDQLAADIDDFVEMVTLANSSVGVGTAAFSKAGAISTQAAGRIGIVGAAISVAGLTGGTLIDLYRHLLPSEFTMVYTTLEMPRIRQEDDGEIYQMRDMLVSARSKEWRLTKTIADTVLTGLGGAGAVRGIANSATDVAAATGRLSTYLDGAGDVITGLDYVSALCDAFAPDCDTAHVTVGPFEWHNISLQVPENDGLFVEFDVLHDLTGPEPSIAIAPRIYYTAINDGTTIVRARPRVEAFGGRTMPEVLHITVAPIAVLVNAPRYVDPGDLVCASGDVRNAHDQSLEWRVVDVDGNLLQQDWTMGTSPHSFCFEVPELDDPSITIDDFSTCLRTEREGYIIVAEAITLAGAREHNYETKPRRGTASVFANREDDICEGLWEVRALEELGRLCTISPPVPTGAAHDTTAHRMLEDMIASGALDTLINIEVLDRGAAIRVSDPATGESAVMHRVETQTTTRDLGVEIILDDSPAADGTITELVPQGDGEYKVVRAAADSTVWADGHHYRIEYRIPLMGAGREIEPMAVSLMFLNPETALANHTWHVELYVTIDTVHTFNCRMDILYVAELIQPE